MTVKLSNNVRSTLRIEAASGDTTLYLSVGHGVRFPSLSIGEYFYATLEDTAGNSEIVKVTARVGDSLTVTRGAEGTAPRTFVAASAIEMRVTAASVIDAAQDAADAVTLTQFGITATAAELNILDGVTATAAELNILDGVTATAAELNVLDGVTATAAELNILDGVTATAAELNILDGVTATTTELNFVDGVTSNIQTQLDAKMATASYPDLVAVEALSSTGIAVRSGSNTWAQRTITGTASQITVTNGTGVSGNPTVAAVIASQAEAEAGTDTTKLMTAERTLQAIRAIRRKSGALALTVSAGSTILITNLNPSRTYYFDFSGLRNSSTATARLRFRLSTDNGSTFTSGAQEISSTNDWRTSTLWGRFTIRNVVNAISGTTPTFEFLTHTSTIGPLNSLAAGIYTNTAIQPIASVNAVEFSFSVNNFDTAGYIFVTSEVEA